MEQEPKSRYTTEIQAMMYTFGDVRTPLPTSAELIEQIVKKQIIEIIIKAAQLAINIRGARTIAIEDIIFVVRKDIIKVSRLKDFLIWKDLRKAARTGNETEGGMPLESNEDEMLNFGTLDGNDPSSSLPKPLKSKRKTMRFTWDLLSAMVSEVSENTVDLTDTDQPHPDYLEDSINRLSVADRITREMSREEYLEYSECRQASFTFKKVKKFRDWLNPTQFIDPRLSDEIIEVLGFLAWEMVRNLTQVALTVKLENNLEPNSSDEGGEQGCTLFAAPTEKTAIAPEDIHAAIVRIRRSCINPFRFLKPSFKPSTVRLY